jgi:hypothetical protein
MPSRRKKSHRKQSRRKSMRRNCKSKYAKPHRYSGTLGDGCEMNYNTSEGGDHGILNPGKNDTCYSRCPITDRTTKDDLLCENNLSEAAVKANDVKNDLKGKVKIDSKNNPIGEYMYMVPPKVGTKPDYYKLKRLGGGSGFGFNPRSNNDLVANAKTVLKTLEGKGTTRRDGEPLTLKSILEDYARINPKYAASIQALPEFTAPSQ